MTIITQVITVAAAGTPVAVSAASVPGGLVEAIHVQGMPANTGRINVGTTALVSSTGVGLIASVGKDPGTAGDMPKWEFQVDGNRIDPSALLIDATVSGEKALVTLFVA